VGLSIFGGCEKFVESVNDGSSEMEEAFCRAEAGKGRAVDDARVAGRFRRGVVCSCDGRGLLE
jgi:hypothetical protein